MLATATECHCVCIQTSQTFPVLSLHLPFVPTAGLSRSAKIGHAKVTTIVWEFTDTTNRKEPISVDLIPIFELLVSKLNGAAFEVIILKF